MGAKPPSPFPSDYDCWFFDVVFGPPTPNMIFVTISGTENCSDPLLPNVDGAYVLHNTAEAPCIWTYSDAEWVLGVELPGDVEIRMREVNPPNRWAFLGGGAAQSRYNNLAVCQPEISHHKGEAIISWGPPPN